MRRVAGSKAASTQMVTLKKEIKIKGRISVRGPSLEERLRRTLRSESIADKYPRLIKESWSSQNCRPASEYSCGSGDWAQWICPNHPKHPIYLAKINVRVRSHIDNTAAQCCPVCQHGVNYSEPADLADSLKAMIVPSKNCNDTDIKRLKVDSRQTVEWNCSAPGCDKKFSARVNAMAKDETGCPRCYSGERLNLREPQENRTAVSFFEHAKNSGFDLRSLPSLYKFWWKCPSAASHRFYERFEDMLNESGVMDCRTCHPKDRVNLEELSPRLMAEYSHDLNEGHSPDNLKLSSRLHWNCSQGHSYIARLSDRLNAGVGCQYCRYGLEQRLNSLAGHPEHARCFDESKNGIKPETVKATGQSAREHKYFWCCSKCSNGWQETVYNFLLQTNVFCPACRRVLRRSACRNSSDNLGGSSIVRRQSLSRKPTRQHGK